MARNRQSHNNHRRARTGTAATSDTRSLRRPPEYIGRQAHTVYGKAFIILEDQEKNTFIYKAGAWVPHTESIAQCRETCQVKQLPQSVNRMIRYEIRCPEGN